jgi:hypothetical protein
VAEQFLDGIITLSFGLLADGECNDPFFHQVSGYWNVIKTEGSQSILPAKVLDRLAGALYPGSRQIQAVDVLMLFQTGTRSLIADGVIIKAFHSIHHNIVRSICQQPERQGYDAIQKLFSHLMNQQDPIVDTITQTIIKIRENIEE